MADDVTQSPSLSLSWHKNPRNSTQQPASKIKMSDEIPVVYKRKFKFNTRTLEIPFHIQEEIVKRLPVVSLLQVRSVSKAWKALIDSSDFIAAHSLTQPKHLHLRYIDLVEKAYKYFTFVDDDAFPQQRSVHTLPRSVVELPTIFSCVGSSHGLLCFYGAREEFRPNVETETAVLWNPSIRKSIAIALPNKTDLAHETELGFGVCPVTCDPKIVKFTICGETSYHCEAEVYSLSSGKWRSLSSNLPGEPFRVFWPQVVVDRFVYWIAYELMSIDSGLTGDNLIMSFDTTDESFGVIDVPRNVRRHPPSRLCISKLRESLVMLEYASGIECDCVVWMMENGVQKSFTKLFTIEAPKLSRTMTTLGFRKSGEAIVEVNYDFKRGFAQSELVVYESISERFNDLEISGAPDTFFVNSYMETLVLLGR